MKGQHTNQSVAECVPEGGDGLGPARPVAIPLVGTDRVALVDPEDVALVSGYRWRLTRSPQPYAVAGSQPKVWMHRLILGLPAGDRDALVDHVNGDGLDNRRGNLRQATHRQNVANSRSRRSGSSRHRGVSLVEWPSLKGGGQSWRADVSPGRRQIYLGTFKSEDEAALAYNVAALLLNGSYARLNRVAPDVVLAERAQRAIARKLSEHLSTPPAQERQP